MPIGRLLGAGALAAGALMPEDAEAAFGGILAKGADKAMLKMAQAMKDRGLSRDDIWENTGWFQGADDKWRFEIDDSQMRMAEGEFMPVGETFGETYQGRLGGRRNLPYHHAFSHPDLMAQYDLPTVAALDPERVARGAYAPNTDTIGLNPALTPEEAVSTGAHETQHAIQRKEGFATGGQPADFPDMSNVFDQLNKQGDLLDTKFANRLEASQGDIASTIKLRKENPEEYAKINELLSNYEVSTIPDLRKAIKDNWDTTERTLSPYSQYKRLAGEVEARNVQERLDWTPDQRRMFPPWTTEEFPASQQIIKQRGSATPGILGATAAGSGAALGLMPEQDAAAEMNSRLQQGRDNYGAAMGVLSEDGPMSYEGTLAAPQHPNVLRAANALHGLSRRLEGSPMGMLAPDATANWLGKLAYQQEPTWDDRFGVLMDWF